MKSLAVILASVLCAGTASARTLTAMNYVEKSAYALKRLVTQKRVDASFLTDVNAETLAVSAAGAQVILYAPSVNPNDPGSIVLNFDAQGNLASFTTAFVMKSSLSPIFKAVDASTILDLGAEAIVDHLGDSADMPVIAQTAKSLTLATEGSAIHIRILLQDGRTFNILMDQQGNVVSKGF